MIYAPPYLIRRRKPKATSIDHELATSPKVPAEAHTKENTGKQSTVAPLLLRSNTRSRRHHTTRQRGTDLSSRTVINKLSGVSVTHDEYRTLRHGSSCLATSDQPTVINMETQAIMACQTSMARG